MIPEAYVGQLGHERGENESACYVYLTFALYDKTNSKLLLDCVQHLLTGRLGLDLGVPIPLRYFFAAVGSLVGSGPSLEARSPARRVNVDFLPLYRLDGVSLSIGCLSPN